jgi:mono/diheme cytochrome c family protein
MGPTRAATRLHGGDFETIRATITNGRDNQMPAHATALGDSKVRLLAAYVLSLSNGDHDDEDREEHEDEKHAAAIASTPPHVGAP